VKYVLADRQRYGAIMRMDETNCEETDACK
jgi:hypothetical protein